MMATLYKSSADQHSLFGLRLYALLIFLLCCSLLVTTATAYADIYKYRDENGRLFFVDDKDKIPAKYQQNTATISESNPSSGTYNSPLDNTNLDISAIEAKPEKPLHLKKKNKLQTPVTIKGNRVLVPVEVAMGNRTAKLTLLLDTGATATVFHRSALTGLELPKGRTLKARVAGGGTVKSKRMKFRYMTVGPFQIKDKLAMVINLQGRDVPFDGMLGMDFLKAHPHQIDYKNQIIIWEK